jgi:hypothetical protein
MNKKSGERVKGISFIHPSSLIPYLSSLIPHPYDKETAL